jgi:hypothetical protein
MSVFLFHNKRNFDWREEYCNAWAEFVWREEYCNAWAEFVWKEEYWNAWAVFDFLTGDVLQISVRSIPKDGDGVLM